MFVGILPEDTAVFVRMMRRMGKRAGEDWCCTVGCSDIKDFHSMVARVRQRTRQTVRHVK